MADSEWVVVFETNTDYEAELVRDRLDDAGLRAVIDTKRDHAFFLTVGDLARVFVRVPTEEADEARSILASAPISDAELEKAAMDADTSVHDDADTNEGADDERGSTSGNTSGNTSGKTSSKD